MERPGHSTSLSSSASAEPRPVSSAGPRRPGWRLLLPSLILALTAACSAGSGHGSHGQGPEGGTSATAHLQPTAGSMVSGWVRFEAHPDGVLVTAEVEGLMPGSLHGFHVHQNGDCSAPDGTSAGGHFDPHQADHGAPHDPAHQRHVGDLGNLQADASGRARYERVDHVLALAGPASVLGRGVIVHAGEDDLVSQPTGAAGARLACGVILADP